MTESSYLAAVCMAFTGWAFTGFIKPRVPESWHKQLPKIAAVVSSALTVGVVAVAQAWMGQPITMDVVLLGAGAGWLAVVGHVFPELVDGRVTSGSDDEPGESE
jgi:hypothetical protein